MEIGYALNADPVQFTLRRTGADHRYLGRDGRWRVDPEPLEPQRVERHDSRTVLGLGPNVVDCLEDDERLRLEIGSIGFAADIVWADIPRSSGRVGSSVFTRPAAPAPAPPPAPPPTPTEPETVVSPESVEFPDPPVRARWLWVVLAVLLVAGAAAGWYWRADISAWIFPPPKPPENDLERIKAGVIPLIQATPADCAGAARLFDGGQRLLKAQDQDTRNVGFHAIDAAAACRFSPAQLQMGKFYDPRGFQPGPGGLEKPNASIAAAFYAQAKANGASEGDTALKELCQHLAQPGSEDEELRTRTVAQYCN